MQKKLFAVFLTAVLMLSPLFSWGALKAEAADLPTESEFLTALTQLRETYPNGSYWCKANGTETVKGYAVSVAGDNRCACTCIDRCTCSEYKTCCGEVAGVGWQGFGFANLMALEIFGSIVSRSTSYITNTIDGWQEIKGSLLTEFFAGDMVKRTNGHILFITKVTEDRVYYVDCNSSGPCQIQWDRFFSSAESLIKQTEFVGRKKGNTLKGSGKDAVTLTLTYDANGGKIEEAGETVYLYKVTGNVDYINFRSAPAIDSANIIGKIPYGSSFDVLTDAPLQSGGYTWLKARYDGKEGYIAKTGSVTGGTEQVQRGYCLNGSVICELSSGKAVNTVLKAGVTYSSPLYTDEYFTLTKDGAVFMGWALQKDAAQPLDEDSLLPERLVSDLSEGSRSVTLYAVWKTTEAGIRCEDIACCAGEEVTLRLILTSGGISRLSFMPEYDAGEMDIVDVQNGDLFESVTYRSGIVTFLSQTDVKTGGIAATVTLRLANDAGSGKFALSGTILTAENEKGEKTEFKFYDGSITVYAAENGHTWDDGKIIKAASDGETDRLLYTCRLCKAQKTVERPQLRVYGKGDIDGTEGISAADARLVLRFAVGLESFNEDVKTAADVDSNQTVDAADARLILRASVGLEDPSLWV